MTVIVRAFRRHRRRYVAGAVLLVLVAGAVVLVLVRTSATAPTPQLATARTGTLSRTVSVTGTIEPARRADLAFTVGGQVVAVDVAVGQQVAVGQSLAAIDAASLPGQVAQARATRASAQARLAADRTAGASSTQIDADTASITAAQAQLDVARRNESQATLTAPFAGTVAAVNVTVGQRVSAGASNTSGAAASGAAVAGSAGSEPDVVVVSTGSYIVDAAVDDTQVGQIAAGQTADITPNGTRAPIAGTVASVGLVATSTSGVASYPVTISVTGSPPNLHIGATAQVEIATQRIDDAVLVPSAAVHGSGAAAAVTVMDSGRQVGRSVVVGATAEGRTQITQGLAAGEQVVLPLTGPARSGGGFGGGGPGGGQTGGGQTGGGQTGGRQTSGGQTGGGS